MCIRINKEGGNKMTPLELATQISEKYTLIQEWSPFVFPFDEIMKLIQQAKVEWESEAIKSYLNRK
jgi:hypothetical protein